MSVNLSNSRKMTTIPVAPCSVMGGKQTLAPYTADYYFFQADK
jgi:hypothetical protein